MSILTVQAMQQGSDAHVGLCGPAGGLAFKDAPDTAEVSNPDAASDAKTPDRPKQEAAEPE